MQEERFYYLVSRTLSGSVSESEKAELQQLIHQDEKLWMLYLQIFPGRKEREEEDRSEALQAYTAHFTKMQIAGLFEESIPEEEEQPPRRRRRNLLMAASVLMVLTLGSWWWYTMPVKKAGSASREVKTPKGSQSYLTLPDGTEVWLNANSKIVYDNDFNQSARNVQLTGEAYFKVAKNQDKPFTIQAGGLKVKVLGTVFNLRSYPDEENIETTLVSGSVAITLNDQPGNTIQLKPGEKLSVHNRISTALITRRIVDSMDTPEAPLLLLSKIRVDPLDSTLLDAAWKEGKLVFDGEEFGKVASKLEKWYNITIIVENENLYNTSFTGVFGKKSLVKVLNALQATGKLTYRQENDTVYVH